jgi:hypothetical protein
MGSFSSEDLEPSLLEHAMSIAEAQTSADTKIR